MTQGRQLAGDGHGMSTGVWIRSLSTLQYLHSSPGPVLTLVLEESPDPGRSCQCQRPRGPDQARPDRYLLARPSPGGDSVYETSFGGQPMAVERRGGGCDEERDDSDEALADP